MANAYVQVTKISNAVGRSNYITDTKRQEEIVLSKSNMTYTWEQHSVFEKENQKSKDENNEAREIIVALPNQLYHTEKLEPFCDELVKQMIPSDHDNEYAVHWNKTRTNLHIHILFSERANQLELNPKVYKRDMWYDIATNKMAKANADGAEIRYKKGEIQKDKNGNIKYQTEIFKAKDIMFKSREYTTKTVYEKTQTVFNMFGFDVDIQTKDSPYLSQKKLYKGASEDYLQKAKEWNGAVKKYNEVVKQHIALEPVQIENYQAIKKEVLQNVKEANSEEKKITLRAIELVNDMANWVQQTLIQLKVFIKSKVREIETMEKWQDVKEKFNDLFEQKKEIENDIIELKKQRNNIDFAEKEMTEIIESKQEIVNEMEKSKEYKSKIRRDFFER